MKIEMKKMLIPASLIIAVGLVFAAKHIKYNSDFKAVSQAGNNAATTEPLPLLLELGSHSCIPCKQMMPILRELTEAYQGQLNVQFIDVMKDSVSAQKYNVRVIPLQIFFDKDGNELFRHEGFYAKEDILAKWKELGFELVKK